MFNAQCKSECELIGDSLAVVSLRLKWLSDTVSTVSRGSLHEVAFDPISNRIITAFIDETDTIVSGLALLDVNGNVEKFPRDTSMFPNSASFCFSRNVNDNSLQIYYAGKEQDVFLYNSDLEIVWQYDTGLSRLDYAKSRKLKLADFNHDGISELYMANRVLNSITGQLLYEGEGSVGCFFPFSFSSECFSTNSVAGDLTSSDGLELACGNNVYEISLNNINDSIGNVANIIEAPAPVKDGFTSLSDIDGDGELEVVVVRNNDRFDGGIWIWNPRDISIMASAPAGSKGGIPQVSDLDGDCRPEIIVTFLEELRVYSYDGSSNLHLNYSIPTSDDSGFTSSTSFDLNGSGVKEIIYRDETNLYIYNGLTGAAIDSFPVFSETGSESPIVTDIDDDGHADILVSGALEEDGHSFVFCFESANQPWAPARRIWNQNGYHVTNVNDDGTIPRYQQNSAAFFDTDECFETTCPQVYNSYGEQATYRTQQGCIVHDPEHASLSGTIDCIDYDPVAMEYTVTFTLYNDLSANRSVLAGLPISFYDGDPRIDGVWIGSYNTFVDLNPGDTLAGLVYTFTVSNFSDLHMLINTDFMGSTPFVDSLFIHYECDYSDNFSLMTTPLISEVVDSICQGEQYELHTIENSTPGIHYISITDVEGCDSIVATLYLSIIDTLVSHYYEVACDSFIWNQEIYYVSATDTIVQEGSSGCDSMDILHLTILTSSHDTISFATCDSYIWEGQVYDTSGFYTNRYTASNGCDSMIILDLLLHDTYVFNDTVEACEDYFWSETGITYTMDTSVQIVYQSIHACDSIYTLQLSIADIQRDTQSIMGCDSVLVLNEWLSTSQTFSDTVDLDNCLNISFYTIQINYSSFTNLYETACDSFYFNEVWLEDSGIYFDTLLASNGCDSIVNLELKVTYSGKTEMELFACDSIDFDNVTYYRDTVLEMAYLTSSNCDSIISVSIDLTFSSMRQTFEDIGCDSVEINGKMYYESTSKQLQFTNSEGCDSLVYIEAIVRSSSSTTLSETACDSFSFNGRVFFDSGTYEVPFINGYGCDSIVELELEIQSEFEAFDTLRICGDYFWPISGQRYSESGIYDFSKTSQSGSCDSTFFLDLAIDLIVRDTLIVDAQSLYTWAVTGETYTSSGLYHASFVTSQGCDSLIVLDLRISDKKDLTWPNIITPSSSVNNTFTLYGEESSRINDIKIYDRWGGLVWNQKDLPMNSPSSGWNGLYNGREISQGVYIWIAEVEDALGAIQVKYGDVLVIR